MSWIDEYVAELKRTWSDVVVMDGFYSRSNGLSWSYDGPVGQVNHHLVTPTTEEFEPVGAEMARDGHSELAGPLCNGYIAFDGTIYLVSAGPANHAGQGRRDVFDRVVTDRPPLGNAFDVYGANSDDFSGGNAAFWGYELQHPGDSTPYPDVQIAAMAAANAAMAKVRGHTANRSIHHKEHSFRKIDLSWTGDLRATVAAAMAGPAIPPPTPSEEDPVTPQDREDIAQRVVDKLLGTRITGTDSMKEPISTTVKGALVQVFSVARGNSRIGGRLTRVAAKLGLKK